MGEVPALDLGSCRSGLQVLQGLHGLSAASQHLVTGLVVTHLMTPCPHVEQKPGVGMLFSVSTVKTSDCPQTWAGLYFVPSVLPRDQKPCILCMGESGREGRAGLSASRECESNHLPHAHQLSAGEHTRGPREPQSRSAGKDFRSRKITLQSPRWEMKETEEGTHRGEEFTEGECLQRRGISRGGASPEGAYLQRGSICRGECLQRRGIFRGRASAEREYLQRGVSSDEVYLQRESICRGGASPEEGHLQMGSICRGGASAEGEYLQRRGICRKVDADTLPLQICPLCRYSSLQTLPFHSICRGGVSAQEGHLCRGGVSAEEEHLQKGRCRYSPSADTRPCRHCPSTVPVEEEYLHRRGISRRGY